MITFQKYLSYTIAVLLMEALLIFFPVVANNCVIYFQAIMLGFLCISAANTLKATYTSAEGVFKRTKIDRYIFVGVTNAILFGTSAYLTKKMGVDLIASVTVFVSGIFLVIAMLISETELNKFFTFSNPGSNIPPPPSQDNSVPPAPDGQ